jgi:hypothetical protein
MFMGMTWGASDSVSTAQLSPLAGALGVYPKQGFIGDVRRRLASGGAQVNMIAQLSNVINLRFLQTRKKLAFPIVAEPICYTVAGQEESVVVATSDSLQAF